MTLLLLLSLRFNLFQASSQIELDLGRWTSGFIESKLRQITSQIHAKLPNNSDQAKVMITQLVLYEWGWDDRGPISYDLNDPYGLRIENRLLSRLLETRKGNCVSMPLLFMEGNLGGHITWNRLYTSILAFGFEEVLPIVACF